MPAASHIRSLLLVHGNGGGGFRFSRCLPYFSSDLIVAAPTLPGFYPEPKDNSLGSLRDYALALLPFCQNLPRPRAILGTGIGGSLVLELLQHHPDLADLLLLHAPVGAHLDKRLFPKVLNLPGVATLAKHMIGHPLLRPLWKRLFFEESLPEEFLTEFFRGYRNCAVFEDMFRLIDHQWWTRLQSMSVPSILLWGERERLLTVDQLTPFTTLLPNSRSEVIPHWRHFPMIEQAQEFAQKVEELLCQSDLP